MIFRQHEPADVPFIRDSFSRAVRSTVATARGTSRRFLVSMLDRCMTSTAWKTTIVCPDEETPDEIGGWVISRSPSEIFWICVKPRYQGLGLGQALLNHIGAEPGPVYAPLIPTHLMGRAAQHGYLVRHRPYLALE